jgi:hypothetical protein
MDERFKENYEKHAQGLAQYINDDESFTLH